MHTVPPLPLIWFALGNNRTPSVLSYYFACLFVAALNGRYWLLRSLKDPIVATILGVDCIPKCKMVSLVVVFFLVSEEAFAVRGERGRRSV